MPNSPDTEPLRAPAGDATDGGGEPLSVLLVDDDPLARRGVRRLLAEIADVLVVGECANAHEAVDAIERQNPDVLLLDVEMPGQSGFDVAESLRTRERPYIVFVTAYDRYAVEAFKSRALDYVLKPVSSERMADAMARARRELHHGRLVRWAHEVRAVARSAGDGIAPPGEGYLSEFLVRVGLREIVVPVADVDWIEADSYYAKLHVGLRDYLLREPLHRIEQRLDPERFARVHRSAIVNVQRVREVRHESPGERALLLATGARVRVSRARWGWFARQLRERTQVTVRQAAGE